MQTIPTTIQGTLIELSDSDKYQIEDLIRRFESSKRYAYVRICDGLRVLDIEKDVANKFALNGRWAKDVVSLAKQAHNSALAKVKAGKLEAPRKLIWGGRKNLEKRQRGEITNDEWKRLRRRQLYSRGEVTKQGNLNTRIISCGGVFNLRLTLGLRNWLTVPLWIPPKFWDQLNQHLQSKPCYTIKIIRGNDHRYRVYITFELPVPDTQIGFQNGATGVDINPSGQALVETNRQGQFLQKEWLGTPELQYARRGRRDWLLWDTAHQIVDFAEQLQKGVVLEGLNFKRDGKSYGRKLNRIFNNFTYRRLIQAIERVCLKRGVDLKFINPAFTSFIGKKKYLPTYKILVVHEAAAYVIARRGLRFQEMPTGSLRIRSEELLESRLRKKHLHSWVFWRVLKPKKKAANSGKGKSSRTQGEGKQGIAPTLSAGGTPAPDRVKGVVGNGNPTREPGVQVERISDCNDMLHKVTL